MRTTSEHQEWVRLRDHFAGIALSSLLKNATELEDMPSGLQEAALLDMTWLCYQVADAMLRARK